MKRVSWCLFAIILVCLTCLSCGGGGSTDDNSGAVTNDIIPPALLSTNPSDADNLVPVGASITLTFTEPVFDTSVSNATIFMTRVSDNAVISGTLTCSGAIVTFTPLDALTYQAQYRLSVTTGVADTSGNQMLSNQVITFTTGADTYGPMITSRDPGANATGVSVSKVIAVAFNEALDCSTFNVSSFLLAGESGDVSCSGNMATFTPTTNLAYSTSYTATLRGTVSDINGNLLGSDATWTFTTTSGSGAPYVTEYYPENGKKGVCLNPTFVAMFSERINHSTLIPGTSFLLESSIGHLAGDFISIDDPAWSYYYPNELLPRNTTITTTITSGVEDTSGNPMESNFISVFKTTWTTLLGTFQDETANKIAIGSDDSVYIAGWTQSDMVPGYENNSSSDIFFAKYASNGEQMWIAQHSSDALTIVAETAESITIDDADNVYVVGTTENSLDGQSWVGAKDLFLIKYDTDGNHLWTTQQGTLGNDIAYDVVANVAGVYVVGVVNGAWGDGSADGFIYKYDQDGVFKWSVAHRTSDSTDVTKAVALDGDGNVFAGGYTYGTLGAQTFGGQDIYLSKVDSNGNLLWFVQDGSAADDSLGNIVISSDGNPVVVGITKGDYVADTLNTGQDFFLAKYDSSTGALIWKQQLGVETGDTLGNDLSIDSIGNIYVVGTTTDGLDGTSINRGVSDFMTKYSPEGVKMWTKTYYSYDSTIMSSTIDSADNIFVTGSVSIMPDPGHLCGNPRVGGEDVFISKFDSDGNKL